MSSRAYEPVRKLAGLHAVESFDCGQSALNQFLQRFALVNQQSNLKLGLVDVVHSRPARYGSNAKEPEARAIRSSITLRLGVDIAGLITASRDVEGMV